MPVEQHLRDLDHELERQRQLRQPERALAASQQLACDLDMGDVLDLGQRDAKARRHRAVAVDQRADEALERRDRATHAGVGERLDADAAARARTAVGERRRQRVGGRTGVTILLGVGADAVAVLEVDAKIFDRRGRETPTYARVHGPCEPGVG